MASVELALLCCRAKNLSDSLMPSLKVTSGPVGEVSELNTLLKWSSYSPSCCYGDSSDGNSGEGVTH